MDDIAIGRKEIMKALHVGTWRTIQVWKRQNIGFRKIVRKHPINDKPFIVIREAIKWMVEYDKINKRRTTPL